MKIISRLIIPAVIIGFVCCGHKERETASGMTGEPITAEEVSTPGPAEEPSYYPGKIKIRNIGPLHEAFNDSNYIQYSYAEKLGIRPLHTLADAYHTGKPIVKVESNDSYTVDRLSHSMPFLVPEAASLLDEIGNSFTALVKERAGGADYRIIVTSLLRSPYTVKRLRRSNVNATDSSTHQFGTTFDISYNHFDCIDTLRPVDGGALKNLLAEVLYGKREEGKCLVKFERKTACFHITTK